jgi:hypothetical protein
MKGTGLKYFINLIRYMQLKLKVNRKMREHGNTRLYTKVMTVTIMKL